MNFKFWLIKTFLLLLIKTIISMRYSVQNKSKPVLIVSNYCLNFNMIQYLYDLVVLQVSARQSKMDWLLEFMNNHKWVLATIVLNLILGNHFNIITEFKFVSTLNSERHDSKK